MELLTVGRDAESRFTEKNSVFITKVFFVTTEEEAAGKIAGVKAEYPDATHHVWAYSLRQFGKQRFSDDGEPGGTAGMPVLNVIRQKNLVNVLVIVVRYFGGTLLGAGGLVRAYGKGASTALEEAGTAKIVTAVAFEVSFGYEKQRQVSHIADAFPIRNPTSDFGEKVTLRGELSEEKYAAFAARLSETFYEGITLTVTGQREARE